MPKDTRSSQRAVDWEAVSCGRSDAEDKRVDPLGGIAAQGQDATWVVREHKIEYFLPAFMDEEIEIRTWVENVRRVRSLRKYEFVRKSDGRVLGKGETDWVFVNVKTGIPRAIPPEVAEVFGLSSQNKF